SAPTGLEEVTVNWTGAGVEIDWASDTVQPPRFECAPLDQDDPRLRLIVSQIVTRDFNGPSGAARAAEAMRLDWSVLGMAFGLVGWREGSAEPLPESDEIRAEQEEVEAELDAMTAEMAAMEGVDGTALEPADYTETVEILGEGGVAVRLSPLDLIIDPTVRWDNWPEARYIGRSYLQRTEDLKRSGLPGASDLQGLRDIRTKSGGKWVLDPSQTDQVRDGVSWSVMVEVTFRALQIDRSFSTSDGSRYGPGEYPVRVLWTLRRPDEPLSIEMCPYNRRDETGRYVYPYNLVVARPVPGLLWGQSDAEIAEPQQRELNTLRSLQMTRADQIRDKFIVPKGMLDDRAKEALESRVVGTVVEVKGGDANVIQAIPRPAVNMEIEQAAINAKEEMNALTGVSDQARGVTAEGQTTATEARLVAQLSSGRAAKDSNKYEQLCVWMADWLWWLRCENGLYGDRVRVRSPRTAFGQKTTIEVLGREHLVPCEVSVSTGSTRLADRGQDLEMIERFVALASSVGAIYNPQTGTGWVNPIHLLEIYAERAGITRDLDALFDVEDLKAEAAMAAQQQALGTMAAMGGAGMGGEMDPEEMAGGAPPSMLPGPAGAIPGGQEAMAGLPPIPSGSLPGEFPG
ncbi:MAG TPA: hypothetical protein VD926_05210, partial [Acidimicrobiales bacterium]|nr:hypothetical protein [Acidimicrobiales bacterium]